MNQNASVKEKKMNPRWYLLIVPFGFLILVYLFDLGQGIYFNNKIHREIKNIILETYQVGGLNTTEEYSAYAKKLYSEKGYSKDDISLVAKDDYYIVVGYGTYKTIWKQIINFGVDIYNEFGYNNRKYNDKTLVSVSYKVYYNEYKEIVIEELKEEIVDDEEDEELE